MGMGESGVVAIRAATASGKMEPASALWRVKKNLPYIPAPLDHKNVLYLAKTGGIITSVDPVTGKVLKEGRSTEAPGDDYASPIAADDKVFVASLDGKVTVLKAGAQWEVLGVNDIGEPIHATPALAGGRIYVRTRGAVYCFGANNRKGSGAEGRSPGPLAPAELRHVPVGKAAPEPFHRAVVKPR